MLLPWERIPRYLHAISPIGGLAVAFALEVQFGLSVIRAFPFVLLLLMFLALYYTTIEFAIGAALGAADLILVTAVNPATGDPAPALLEAPAPRRARNPRQARGARAARRTARPRRPPKRRGQT